MENSSTSHRVNLWLQRVSTLFTAWTGTSTAFLLAFASIVVWLACGPLFHFSDTWQLIMNTVSSIVTFLMVFLIQRSQNKESLALQLKMNEMIAAQKGANNRLIDIEELSEEELKHLRQRYQRLAEAVKESASTITTAEEERAQLEHVADEAHRAAADLSCVEPEKAPSGHQTKRMG